jgi:membrane protease YdiL (CAAX protease family)
MINESIKYIWALGTLISVFNWKKVYPYFLKRPEISLVVIYIFLLQLVNISSNSISASFGHQVITRFEFFSNFVSPFWEEIIRLGFLSVWNNPLLSSLIFAFSHQSNDFFRLFSIFLFGYTLFSVTKITKSIWNAIIIHFFINFVQISIFYKSTIFILISYIVFFISSVFTLLKINASTDRKRIPTHDDARSTT